MTSDLQALLAGIVADPSDDTARLVYADCLEENGNAPRARFIRLQIEAERHHLHSHVRAEIEREAEALFKQHWMEWWGEVCAAVGLPQPEEHRLHRAGSYAISFPNAPFVANADLFPVTFQRGFPQSVAMPTLAVGSEPAASYLARWGTVSPLTELLAAGALREPRYAWPEGSHLGTVQRLALHIYDTDTFRAALGSPNLPRLECLTLQPPYDATGALFPIELAAVLASAWWPRLKRFTVPVDSRQTAELIAEAQSLTALDSLQVHFGWSESRPSPFLRALAGSVPLSGVRELTLRGLNEQDDIAAILGRSHWRRLRYLELDFGFGARMTEPLCLADRHEELEEFRIAGIRLTPDTVRDLAQTPLLKRVKHFTVFGNYDDGRALLPLVDAVDPARIETFAIRVPHFPERATNALRAKFGDRVRFLPA